MRKGTVDVHPETLTGAQAMCAALVRHGVDTVFGQSIPAALFIAAPDYRIHQVGYRTENAGAVMADAYARISGKVAVVTAQNGPAATLLVAGLAEAMKASVPVVAIVQDVARHFTDKNAFQEYDHLGLFSTCAKWVRRIADVDRIDDYMDMAFTVAASGRPGPAVLIVPIDLFDEKQGLDLRPRRANLGMFPLDRSSPDPAHIERAAELLATARNPLVIAGGGIHLSRAWEELEALQEQTNLPVATTTMGKGAVDETHSLSLGVIGYFMGPRGRTRHMRHIIDNADVILLVGNRTNQNGTDSWTLLPKDADYIHLDIDPCEIGRNYEALRLVGDARLGLSALRNAMLKLDLGVRHKQRRELESGIRMAKARAVEDASEVEISEASPLRPERLMHDLDSILTPETIVVADASYSSIWIANYLTARGSGMRFLTPRGMAGLGWGLPFALGAKCAKPNYHVFALVGDGGFAHMWSELETARRMGLHVVIAVLNNSILGYEKHAEKVMWGTYSGACDFHSVDHAKIARGAGCNGVRIETADQFLPALKDALTFAGTTVLDVITDELAYPPITAFGEHERLKY